MAENTKAKIWRVRDGPSMFGEVYSLDLRMRGFEVQDYIFSPETAYRDLSVEKQEGLAVVDASLVCSSSPGRFSSENTWGDT